VTCCVFHDVVHSARWNSEGISLCSRFYCHYDTIYVTKIVHKVLDDEFLIQTDLVYVNYGRVEDYKWLDDNTNINVTGRIVLARYGKIFRGDKVCYIKQTSVFVKQMQFITNTKALCYGLGQSSLLTWS
jgi:hypothetical protein